MSPDPIKSRLEHDYRQDSAAVSAARGKSFRIIGHEEVVVSPIVGPGDCCDDGARILDFPPDFIKVLPLAVYACDAEGRIRWFNRRAEELWGRRPPLDNTSELFCGAYRTYSLDGAELGRTETAMARAMRSGRAIRGEEIAIERPDGSRATALEDVELVRDKDGRICGAIDCLHETTELRQVNARLREAEKRAAEREESFRQLLDALPAAVYTTDATGRITYYNQAAADLAGRSPELGQDRWCVTWRLYEPDGSPLPHDTCPMAVALKENRPVRGVEALAERPDGSRIPFIPYPTPLRDSAGNLFGAVNVMVDISERARSEGRQRSLLNELNHRVKNNMQMLHSLLRAAQRDTQSAEARTALSGASQRVAAMAAAQQVLYDTESPTDFGARVFLEAVCATARQSFGKTIDIAIEKADGELTNAMAIPLALILNELLVNAAKHGIEGKDAGRIRVGLTRTSGEFELYVADNGAGFDPESVRRRSGLKLVIGLAHQLRGRFEVTCGHGTRCAVRIPEKPAK